MFGAKYSRLTFWIWSVVLWIPFSLFATLSRATEMSSELANLSLFFSGLLLVVIIMWMNALANRIRDYGSNPWISVFSLLPLVNIGLALYYGIAKYKNKPLESKINSSNSSLPKAVYNHSKDIASEIKPTINEYKAKHSSSNTTIKEKTSSIPNNLNEDEIYEQIMIEIEEDKKVKSTWAKALAQSDGNKDKAESLYINFRFVDIKKEIYNKIEDNVPKSVNLDKSTNLNLKEIDFLKKNDCTEKSINVIFDDKIIRVRNRDNNICFDRFTNEEFIIPAEKFEKISSRENAYIEKKSIGINCSYCETLNSLGNPYCYKCKKPITLDCLIKSYKKN